MVYVLLYDRLLVVIMYMSMSLSSIYNDGLSGLTVNFNTIPYEAHTNTNYRLERRKSITQILKANMVSILFLSSFNSQVRQNPTTKWMSGISTYIYIYIQVQRLSGLIVMAHQLEQHKVLP